ncbi:DUF4145 domain-containing protein [Rhizobium ruizarguesonis]|nr:DUF4145 domain-containing protein [Rhizobium ruizarguesonis]
MPVDRSLWKRELTHARWPCPSCRHGELRLERDTLHYGETLASRRSHNDEGFHITDMEFAFSALLKCASCGEIVGCSGTGGMEEDQFFDSDGDPHSDLNEVFYVKFFSKALPIIRPPSRCPTKIKQSLTRSFHVAFCDVGAAANHVRQCVEELLTAQGIDRHTNTGGFLQLEKRIQRFSQKDAENAERASALRWVGHFGSHPENLKRDDLFDAYDILEVLLEDIYVGHQRSVRAAVDRINKNKRPGP